MEQAQTEQAQLQMPQIIEHSIASTSNDSDEKQMKKSILREKKKQLIQQVKCIILTQLLMSILVIFMLLLFYVILSKQFEGQTQVAYLSSFIASDSLFSIGWIFSLVSLPFRNDVCAKLSIVTHSVSILVRIIGIVFYAIFLNEDSESSTDLGLIIGVYGILFSLSVATIIGLNILLKKWQFYPPERWQRRFNPNLRFQDVIDHQNKLASKVESSSNDTYNDEIHQN